MLETACLTFEDRCLLEQVINEEKANGLEVITVDIIRQIEQAQMRKDLPDFGPGDTVSVFKVVEGGRERVQPFDSVVIRRQNGAFVRLSQ